MEPVITGLYASDSEPLPFAPSEQIRAFLLRREQGNLLVYSAPAVAADAAAVAALGGVSRIYLNHWHEAAFGAGERVRTALGVPLVAHADDAASAAESAEVAETFDERGRVGDDFELIPIPGHTPGATAFLWHGGGRRVLFTGDSIYLDDGEWVGGGARLQRPRRVRRESRADPRARLRRARPVGGERRPSVLRRDRPCGRAPAHR
jgi:glyoxylase-like metal-dependent hydrolase (beta-lactamase superfamily II)